MIRSRSLTSRTLHRWAPLLGCAGLLALASCNDSSSAEPQANEAGTILQDPDSLPNAAGLLYSFFVDDNFSGLASELRLAAFRWGRLVDVYALDADGDEILMQREFVIGSTIDTDTSNYRLTRNAVTGSEQLLIRRDVTSEDGLAAYFELLRDADEALTPIFDTGAGGSGFFTFVPRNAALVIVFDDLLDASTISSETIHAQVGVPSVLPFDARIIGDRNHGDLASPNGGEKRFFTSRVIVDATVSEVESFTQDPPLPANSLGFPPSVNVNQANVQIRIPTQINTSVGQESLLENPTGHSVTTLDNGSFDASSITQDVTRSFRSGGDEAVTGDDFNGFLPDETPPQVLGTQLVSISALPLQDPDDQLKFLIPQIDFVSVACAQGAVPGDVIRQPGIFLEVIRADTPLSGTQLLDVEVRVLAYPPEWDELSPENPTSEWLDVALGQAQFLSPFDPVVDAGTEGCFFGITPLPGSFQTSPTEFLSTASTVSVRFSEPMDPSSVTAFDGMTLTRQATPTSGGDYVVGEVGASIDLLTFTFVPSLPLNHGDGAADAYFLTLTTGAFAPTDLAGNALSNSPPQVTLAIDPMAQPVTNNGHVVRFAHPDEEAPFGDEDVGALPEWNGQHFYDLQRQLIRPRPVVRFDATVDRGTAVPNSWTPYTPLLPATPPIREPLVPDGCRLQIAWRNADLDLPENDSIFYNIDVEEMAWAPRGGAVQSDVYEEFQISLAHSAWLPDELFDPLTGAPIYPFSGLTKTFAGNLLDQTNDPLKIVHPRFLGYVIEPAAAFQSPDGQVLMPYPLNRDLPATEFRYYTWRDTSLQARAGLNGNGAEPDYWLLINGVPQVMPPPPAPPFWPKLNDAENVQSVRLPLLMDFRCYPTDQALGLNEFDVALGHAQGAMPVFRAFSAGGDRGNQNIDVDPDLETVANGGFNPNSTPPGATTPGTDSLTYFGGISFVVRVSRSVSIWYEATSAAGSSVSPSFQPPVIVPPSSEQPQGTSVAVAFRGATVITEVEPQSNALKLDAYGDYYDFLGLGLEYPDLPPFDNSNQGVSFTDSVGKWYGDISQINGANYYQMRVTFISNTDSGQSPELSAVGVTWTH